MFCTRSFAIMSVFVYIALSSACSRNGALWSSYSENFHQAVNYLDSDGTVFQKHYAAVEQTVAELEVSRISATEISNIKGCLTSLRQYRQVVARETAIAIGREIESCLKTAELKVQ